MTISFNKDSSILACEEDPSIPMNKLNRKYISDI